MNFKEMFHPDLIDLDIEARTKEDAFLIAAEKLKQRGLVEESYYEALKEREHHFPTGLRTQFLNIALPHTDPQHVRKPFVYIVRLVDDVEVLQMGDNEVLGVKHLFFLGIKNPSQQVQLLSKLMELFMDEDFVHSYKASSTQSAIYELFSQK